jgi:hypothetical protein
MKYLPTSEGATKLDISRWYDVDEKTCHRICGLYPKLRYLDVSGVPIENQGVMVLVSDPRAVGLETLRLGRHDRACGIKERGLRALAESEYLTGLRKLELATFEDVSALLCSQLVTQLSVLVLEDATIDSRAFGDLCAIAARLESLAFLNCKLPDDAMQQLVDSAFMMQLQRLAIRDLPPAQARVLLDGHWPSLHTLALGKIDKTIATTIIARGGMPVLQALNIDVWGGKLDGVAGVTVTVSHPVHERPTSAWF